MIKLKKIHRYTGVSHKVISWFTIRDYHVKRKVMPRMTESFGQCGRIMLRRSNMTFSPANERDDYDWYYSTNSDGYHFYLTTEQQETFCIMMFSEIPDHA